MRTTNAALARDLMSKFPRHSHRTIARMLLKQHPLRFGSFEAARGVVRDCSPTNRKNAIRKLDKSEFAPIAKVPPPLPESFSKPWLPYNLKGKKILVLSDVHVPYHDKPALEAALEHGDKFQPDVVLLNGDISDFYTISRYERNPESRPLRDEILAVRRFLEHMRVRYPDARIVYKMGNHEERWWSYIWRRAPELLGIDLADFDSLVQAKQNGVEIIGEQRIIQVGLLSILHGHELPKGLTNPVNPARGAFLRAIDILMIGHHHRTSENTETSMLGRTITTWSTGCLCTLHPEYMRINKHNHGFATVESDGRDFTVRNLRIHKGRIL